MSEDPREEVNRRPGVGIGPVPEGEVIVNIHDLTKLFPLNRPWAESVLHPLQEEQVAVVRKVTLEIRTGEIFGLLGVEGAGKTTLLKMLSGEILPDGGSGSVGGFDLGRQGDEVRRIVRSMTGNGEPFHPDLTARENLERAPEAPGAARGGSEGGAEVATMEALPAGRIEEVLQATRLTDAADRRVGVFTPSMKRRLLIARALLPRPALLLLDEPFQGLDRAETKEVRDILSGNLGGWERCTVVLATRAPEDAFAVCHRVGILAHGRLLAVRTPHELLEAVGTEWYRLWMRQAGLDSLMTLTGHREIRGFRSHASGLDGWSQVEIEIPGGLEAAARVLQSLTAAGVEIARFERVGLTLPQLIDRLGIAADPPPQPARTAEGGREASWPNNPPLIL